MNIQLNAVPEAVESSALAPSVSATPLPFYWSLRRELWENRSIYLAPLAVAGVVLFGFFATLRHLPATMRAASALDPMRRHELIEQPFDMAAGLIMVTFLIVAVFYCLDALHGERRDRSILFWKSLPVSDLTVVLSKATIPFLILPLFTVAVTVVTQLIMAAFGSAVLIANGQGIATTWSELSFVRMSLLLLYHIFTVHVLLEAPMYAWMLMVSSWARRATFIWAFVPPFAICVLEKMLFNTSHFALMLLDRLTGGMEALSAPGTMPMDPTTETTVAKFLTSPSLWIGLAITAAFLFAAVRLRRYRGPI
jgi:ABC-2 type transport system permease protein